MSADDLPICQFVYSVGFLDLITNLPFWCLTVGSAAVIDAQWLPYGPVACFQALLFIVAVRLHRTPFALQPRVEQALANVKLRMARLEHDWPTNDTGLTFAIDDRPELTELRVFGAGSVYQQINRSGLTLSQTRLAERLTSGLAVEQIPNVQLATQSLMSALVFRRRMEVESRLLALQPDALENTIQWAEDPEPPMSNLGALRIIFSVLSIATLIQVGISLATDLETAWSITLLLQVLLFVLTTGHLGRSYHFAVRAPTPDHYQRWLPIWAYRKNGVKTQYLDGLQKGLNGGRTAPYVTLEAFDTIVDRLSVRHGPMLHALLGILLGWEIHWVCQLRNGGRSRSTSQIVGCLIIRLGIGLRRLWFCRRGRDALLSDRSQ